MVPIGTEKELHKAIERQIVKCEEITIKAALKNVLGREPTIEDAKRCSQILSEPWDGSYRLLYNKEEIGTVKYIDEPEKFRVEFYPIQKSN